MSPCEIGDGAVMTALGGTPVVGDIPIVVSATGVHVDVTGGMALMVAAVFAMIVSIAVAMRTTNLWSNAIGYGADFWAVPGLVGVTGTDLAEALVRAEPVHQAAWQQAVRQHAMDHLAAWQAGASHQTRAEHVMARRWLPIDVIPVRASTTTMIAATDAEHVLALERTRAAMRFSSVVVCPRTPS